MPWHIGEFRTATYQRGLHYLTKPSQVGYQQILLNFVFLTKSLQMYMFGVVGETHANDYFEVISFYNSKAI